MREEVLMIILYKPGIGIKSMIMIRNERTMNNICLLFSKPIDAMMPVFLVAIENEQPEII
jgi:hypothetical protein